MIPGTSLKDLVTESPDQQEDGISQIILAQLFKPGPTEFTHVGAGALKTAPPLPTGYTLYKDGVYDVKTQAIVTAAFNITVFNIPSVANEQEFKRLSILHLKYDVLSPSGKSWEDVTLSEPPQNESVFHFISRAKYDSLQADFDSRRLAAVSGHFGIFAIASVAESWPERTEPFPAVVMNVTSSPEPVRPNHEVTHEITFTNRGTSAAAEIDLKEVLDIDLDFVSVNTTQGLCQQKEANNIVVCNLGGLRGGATATIKVTSRARNSFFPDMSGKMDPSKLVVNSLEVIFKQVSTDFVDERGQIFSQVSTTIINDQPNKP